MSKYKEIKGFKVQTLASDTAASAVAGGSWASGGALPAAKYVPAGSAGTQTSNLVAGGASGPPANSNQVNTSFEYDGSSWTAGGNLNTTRFGGGGLVHLIQLQLLLVGLDLLAVHREQKQKHIMEQLLQK